MCSKDCYLQKSFQLFPSVCSIRERRHQNLGSIEALYASVCHSRDITDELLDAITTNKYWKADVFAFPNSKMWEKNLHDKNIDLKPQRITDRPSMLSQLKIASGTLPWATVLLRFIDPENYFILAGPSVTGFFPMPDSGGTKTLSAEAVYLEMCGNLKKLGKNHGMKRVADVDIALWTLWQLGKKGPDDPEVRRLHEKYQDDPFVAGLRTQLPVLNRILGGDDWIPLAELILVRNPRLAGALLGIHLETQLYRASAQMQRRTGFYDRLNSLKVDKDKKKRISDLWELIRNMTVHEEEYARMCTQKGRSNVDATLRFYATDLIQILRAGIP